MDSGLREEMCTGEHIIFFNLEQQSKWEKQAILPSGNTGDTNVMMKVGFEHDARKNVIG